jgi:hypothetical protein
MAIGSVSPVGVQQFFDANGDPLSGGTLGFFLAGTDTPTPVYADFALSVALPNPVVLDAAGRAPQLFLAAVSYKQVLKDAQGVTIWTADNIVTPTALRSTAESISLTGLQHDVPVPAGVISFLSLRNASPLTIDGFANGTPGQVLVLRALGTGPVYLAPPAGSGSRPENQLINFVNSGPTPLAPFTGASGCGTAMYTKAGDGPWILVAHEQGGWLPLDFAALTFRAADTSGTTIGAWTVPLGSVQQGHYRLSGANLLLSLAFIGTTVAPTGAFLLMMNGLPYQVRTTSYGLPAFALDGGATEYKPGQMYWPTPTRELGFYRGNDQPWTPTTQHQLYAQATFDVQ